MNLKIIIAVLIAAFMVVPCAAAMDATAVVAEDDSSELKVGDAWGISHSMKKTELIGYLIDVEEIDAEDLEMYNLIFEAIKKADFNMAFIIEVTRADESGYTVAVDGGIRLNLSAKYNGDISAEDEDELLFNIDGYVDVIILMQGKVNLNADSVITSFNLDLNIIIDSKITTNLSLIKLAEYMDQEDEEVPDTEDEEVPDTEDEEVLDTEIEAITKRDVFTETNNTSNLKVGASVSYRMYSTGESGVSANYNDEDEVVSYTISLDGKQSISASIFALVSGDLAELLKLDMDDDSDFIVDDAVRASLTFYYTSIITDSTTIDVTEIADELLDEEIEIPGFINGLFLGTEEHFSPDLFLLEILDVDREGEYYLENTGEVRGIFNSIKGAYNGAVSGLEFVVTYDIGDEDDNPTQTVAFNGLIKPPTVPNNSEDEKFVGWETDNGTEWNPSWGVKGDLTLQPIYAKSFTGASELVTHMKSFLSTQYGYMKIDSADLTDAFESGDFDFRGTMFVDVYNGDNFLYSWKITNDGTALDTNTTMKLNIDKDDLTDEQRKKLADGRNSGEGNFMYIKFGASGTMPGTTTVTYNVGNTFNNGTNLQIYYVITDGEGNIIGLEPVRNATVVNGNAVFDIDHCSGYVLSEIITSDAEDSNTLLYIGIAAAAIILIIIAAVFVMRSRSNNA